MKRSFEHTKSEGNPQKRQSRFGRDGSIITNSDNSELPPDIGRSQTIEDRLSKFQSFFVPIGTVKEISTFVIGFKQTALCENVDHAMLAYRISEPGIGLSIGSDDDGERFAGKKLADLLESMNVYGLVIVIRQYGGIMLGPIRFQHITQCARDAIMDCRRIKSLSVIEKEKIQRLLLARDKTIVALRGIIQEKKANITKEEDVEEPNASQSSISGSQLASKEYSAHDLTVLRRLLLARDMTIKSLRAGLEDIKDKEKAI